MSKMIVLGLAAAAALAFNSCTCPACGGSGLQVRTNSGWVATDIGAQGGTGHETRPCQPCNGTGFQGFGAFLGVAEVGLGTYQAIDDNRDRRARRKYYYGR